MVRCMSATEGPWWAHAFDASYAERYAHRDDAAAAAELVGILPLLRRQQGPVLDACCGAGRHLQVMRGAGLPAFGFDWSLPLLQQALGQRGLAQRVLRADMRQPPLASGWAAITMLFTAFGYFEDEENAQCLRALALLLRRRGLFVVDVANAQQLRQTLVPESQRRLADGSIMHEQRWLEGPRVCKRSRWQENGQERVVEERVRLYEASEMVALAASASCELETIWPSLRGADIDEGRMVCFLRRVT
ncbi:MAG: methyltransferase domain-containing protein [Planctomycetota bacterium]|nr:MAG: methyltransferase domain-containing protein [Planctomycetota bacterium]